MKIGKFSESNNVSIDTIRHYIDIGLITPEKIGGHYSFDEKCKNDLEEIMKLKDMGFTLGEIKEIYFHKFLGKLTRFQENETYKSIYKMKLKKLEEKMVKLSHMKANLKEQIIVIDAIKSEPNFTLGFDLSLIENLACNECGGDIKIKTGTVEDGQIIDGILLCSCENEYIIEDGILYVEYIDSECGEDSKFDIDEDITEYIKDTDNDYLSNITNTMEWSYNKIDYKNCKNQKVLELGIGSGFYLRSIYNDLSDELLYVGTDIRKSSNVALKRILERAEVKKNINLICANFENLPFKESIFDILVDFTGTSNYGFENKEFLLNIIDKFTKAESLLIGTYIIFEKFNQNRYIKEGCKQNFDKGHINNCINKLDYEIINENSSKSVNKSGKFERFFDERESVYSYSIYAKK